MSTKSKYYVSNTSNLTLLYYCFASFSTGTGLISTMFYITVLTFSVTLLPFIKLVTLVYMYLL